MTIAEEAQQYLAVVDVFRREGCEPHWRPESRPERSELSPPSNWSPPSVPGRKQKWTI